MKALFDLASLGTEYLWIPSSAPSSARDRKWGVARAICILIGPQRHRACHAHSNTQTLLHIPRLHSRAKKIKFRRVPHESEYHLLSAVSNEIIKITGKNHIVRWWRRQFFFSIRLGINWTESRQIFNEAVAHYFPAESNEIQQLADRITLGAVVIARPINIRRAEPHSERRRKNAPGGFCCDSKCDWVQLRARCCWNGFINKILRLLS